VPARMRGRAVTARPVVLVLEPDPTYGQTEWSATVLPDRAAARTYLAARTLAGWKAVHLLPLPTTPPTGEHMTYIAALDPEQHDPELDTPFRCDDCKWEGTWEDCDRAIDSYLDRSTLGIICPQCRLVQWQDDEPMDGPA
jgi:hypothetical protein